MFFNNYHCRNIEPGELHRMIRSGKKFLLLDVRTRQENEMQAIEGSYLVPLQELAYRLDELPRDREIVVYCRIGSRSAHACSFLAGRGYTVKNLEGGIVQWNKTGEAVLSQA